MSRRIVVVGGVAAGASAATRARRLNEQAEIVIYEKSGYVSFANCGLPYHVGNVITDRSALLMQTPEQFRRRYDIEVKVQHEVVRIDPARKEIAVRDLASGQEHSDRYDTLILTPGAAPFMPPLEGMDAANVFVLRTMEDMDRIKACIEGQTVRRATVLGAGFIGLECADVLTKLGIETDVVELVDQVLPPLDPDMAEYVARHLAEQGVTVRLGQPAKGFIVQDGRARAVELQDGTRVPTDIVLVGVGIRPNSGLGRDAGLELGPRGHLRVDDHLQTSVPDIYAAGDVAEVVSTVTASPVAVPLAGPANKHGRLAGQWAATGAGPSAATVAGTAIVQVFDLHVALTGLSLKAALAAGLDAASALVRRPHHVSYYPGAEPLVIKLIYERGSRRLLGGQVIGRDGVEARIDVLATTLHFGGRIDDVANLDLAYAPQFGSAKDPLHIAAFVAQNQEDGLVAAVTADGVEGLGAQTQLVDVRTPEEFSRGSIPGARNIPWEELRARIDELPKDDPIVVYCQTGQRSYNAARILMQRGYKSVYNLVGGFADYAVHHLSGSTL